MLTMTLSGIAIYRFKTAFLDKLATSSEMNLSRSSASHEYSTLDHTRTGHVDPGEASRWG